MLEENIWCLSVESFDEETSERKIFGRRGTLLSNDWEEFLKTLEGYAQAPDKQMENTFEILLPPNGEIKYTTEELNIIADALDGDVG